MNATAEKTEIIHSWNSVDWNYPSCGGTIGSVDSNGIVSIEHLSNLQGQSSGSVSVWQLNQDAIDAINTDRLDDQYNEWHTWRQMIECFCEHIATMLSGGRGRIVR